MSGSELRRRIERLENAVLDPFAGAPIDFLGLSEDSPDWVDIYTEPTMALQRNAKTNQLRGVFRGSEEYPEDADLAFL